MTTKPKLVYWKYKIREARLRWYSHVVRSGEEDTQLRRHEGTGDWEKIERKTRRQLRRHEGNQLLEED